MIEACDPLQIMSGLLRRQDVQVLGEEMQPAPEIRVGSARKPKVRIASEVTPIGSQNVFGHRNNDLASDLSTAPLSDLHYLGNNCQ
jgi:hypothetical protein